MSAETVVLVQAWASVGGVLIGLVQCALIWVGLNQMRTASATRDRQIDAQTETLAAVVRGLETVIERTAPDRGRG